MSYRGWSIASFVLVCAAPSLKGQTYTVSEVDPVGKLLGGNSVSVEDDGVILVNGALVSGGNPSGILCSNGNCLLLPILPGDIFAQATGRNSTTVVGNSKSLSTTYPPYEISRPVRWLGNQVVDLNALLQPTALLQLLSADSINSLGAIVGTGVQDPANPFSPLRGFLMHQGVIIDLGDPPGMAPGTSWVRPAGIDDAGRVVGMAFTSAAAYHAFLWSGGVMTDLHDPTVIQGSTSYATDSDRFGSVCGYATFHAGPFVSADELEAAYWSGASIVNLGSLGGGDAKASAMNDLGVIVGRSKDPTSFSYQTRAVVWKNGVLSDLNSLIPPGSGWTLLEATDVTNDGRIVGSGRHGALNTPIRPFLLTPVCAGHFSSSGSSCAPGSSLLPTLAGIGCPTPGSTFALTLSHGAPLKAGIIAVGSGTSTLPISSLCSLSIAPLLPLVLSFALDANGELFLPIPLPSTLPIVDVNLQSIVLGANGLLQSTNAISLHIE